MLSAVTDGIGKASRRIGMTAEERALDELIYG
jgi:hypothetical protein